MPEEETTATTAEADEETTTTDDLTDDERSAVEKAENPDAVRNAISRQKEAAKAAKREADELRAKVQEFEDASKSEKERAESRAAAAEGEAKEAKATALRYEVAAAKGVPLTQAHRLQGSTKEELETDADAFLKDIKGGNGGSGFDGGARGTDDRPKDFDAAIRGSAAR